VDDSSGAEQHMTECDAMASGEESVCFNDENHSRPTSVTQSFPLSYEEKEWVTM